MKKSILRISLLSSLITAVLFSTFLLFHTITSSVFAGGSCNPIAGSSTIQAAINNGACTTISVGTGTFTENLTVGRDVTIRGAGSSTIIDGDGNGRVLTIDGNHTVTLENLRFTNGDATGDATAARNGGGIYATNGAILHATNIYVDNNIASTSASTGFGGGIGINASTAYITDTTVMDNYGSRRSGVLNGSGRGGGLYINNNATLTLKSSNITTNTAAYRAPSSGGAIGGGLFIQGNSTANLYNNSWQYNVARGENSTACPISTCVSGNDTEGGGAIGTHVTTPNETAVVNITGDSFAYNIANNVNASSDNSGRGGAIAFNTSNTDAHITATLKNVTMYNNVAARIAYGSVGEEGRGGGIFARHTALTVDKSTILDNDSATTTATSGQGHGGGIYVREPETGDYTTVTNSVIAGNRATNLLTVGAQIHINYVSGPNNDATILNSTLADDTQSQTLALFYNGTSAGDSLIVGNTIIANHDNGIRNINATGKARARYLLFYNVPTPHAPSSTAFPGSPSDDTTWITGNPLFADAPNGDYHITAGSAAYNTGTNEAGYFTNDDIDGDPRPLFTQYDIGADELIYPVYLPMVIK